MKLNKVLFMLRSKSIVIVTTLLLLPLSCLAAEPIKKLLNGPNNIPELKENDGYMVVDLEVAGTAPSIEFIQVATKSSNRFKRAKKVSSQPYKLILKDAGQGLKIMALPEGTYQVTQVNAPFFTLPHKLDTSDKPGWRFSIEEGKLNYIGKLVIEKARATNFINVRLLNRLATDKDKIQQEFAGLTASSPLISGTGVRDDFWEFINEANEDE